MLRVVTLNAQMICYMLIGTTVNAIYRAVAGTLHVAIERPTQRLGRRMARAIDRRTVRAAAVERSPPARVLPS